MWWQFKTTGVRKTACAAALLFLCACGFHPMYGDSHLGKADSAVRGNVSVDAIGGRDGQIFKTALDDKLNPESVDTTNAQYRLSINLKKILIPAVVKSDGTIQRYDMRLDSNFSLYKAGSKEAIFTGRIRRTGSYNVAIDANFASYEAEQDVTQRTLEELAEDYVMRISGYLEARPADKPAAKFIGPMKPPMTPTPPSALIIAPSRP